MPKAVETTVTVKANQHETFARPVGQNEIVRIEPWPGDTWLCDGRNWVHANGSGQGASQQAPRLGESEGAVVIFNGVNALMSFAGGQHAIELPGPIDLYLGPNMNEQSGRNKGRS